MVQILNTQDGTVNLVSGEEYIVPQGQLLTASSNSFAFAAQSGIVLVIEGTTFSGGGDGTSDNSTTDDVEVLIGRTGSVWAWSDGLEFSGTGITVRNLGSIIGAGDSGVEMLGVDSFLSNSGTIEGVGHGVQTDNATSIVNSGLIVGERGVDMRGGGTELVNSGTIQSPGRFESLSTDSAGVYFYSGDDFVIRNTGLISGPEYSIAAPELTFTDAEIMNSGTLDGDVRLNAGQQTIWNSGTILGDVSMGGGNDEFRASASGVVTGAIDMGAGNDTFYGSRFEDEVHGSADQDVLIGRDGDDYLDGGAGRDVLRGGRGEDELVGGNGADELFGGADDDMLFGGGNSDTIKGGAGDDEIAGGSASDDMYGGSGADTFVYLDTSDSLNDGTYDRIFGFNIGEDQLDVSALGVGFTFLGSDGFTGAGTEIRVLENASGLSRVLIDVDGVGGPEMRINLFDVTGITVDDFIF